MQVGRIASFSTDPNQSEYDKTFDKGGNLSPWESQKVGGVNFKRETSKIKMIRSRKIIINLGLDGRIRLIRGTQAL